MYIETEKGKMPIRYGWNALAKFGDLVGLSMDEILSLDPSKLKISELLTFIYVGLKEGSRKEGEDCKIGNEEDLGDLIDKDIKIISKAMDAFVEFVKNAEDTSEDSKKK